MAKTYRLTPLRRLANAVITSMLRAGMAPRNYAMLTVVGRKTGRARSTPVRLIHHGGSSWLVSPYGEVAWVLNARAAGELTLTIQGVPEAYRVVECAPAESAPVLKEYARAVPITRPYFDADSDDPPERFAAEADRHPVFRLE